MSIVIYWSLTEPSIKRYTRVNKRMKKRVQLGVMKEYRQMPAAVELVQEGQSKDQLADCGPQRPSVEQPKSRCGRSAAVVRRKSWVNIAVCPCRHSSLAHNRNINPLKNKVWDIYIFFIKECIRSFIEVRKLCFRLYMYTRSIRLKKWTVWLEFEFAYFDITDTTPENRQNYFKPVNTS